MEFIWDWREAQSLTGADEAYTALLRAVNKDVNPDVVLWPQFRTWYPHCTMV